MVLKKLTISAKMGEVKAKCKMINYKKRTQFWRGFNGGDYNTGSWNDFASDHELRKYIDTIVSYYPLVIIMSSNEVVAIVQLVAT